MTGGGRGDGGMFWVPRLPEAKIRWPLPRNALAGRLLALPNKIFAQITSIMIIEFKILTYDNCNLRLTLFRRYKPLLPLLGQGVSGHGCALDGARADVLEEGSGVHGVVPSTRARWCLSHAGQSQAPQQGAEAPHRGPRHQLSLDL